MHRLVGPHEADRARRGEQLRLQACVGRASGSPWRTRGATLCPGSASTAVTVPSCGARTTIRCRAAFSADLLRQRGEVALDLALARALRAAAARGVRPASAANLAPVGGALALERDQLRLDAEQLLGLACDLRVGDEVLGAERLELRQRLLGELLALALQGLLLGQGPSSRCIASIRGRALRQAGGFELRLLGAKLPRRLSWRAFRLDAPPPGCRRRALDSPTARTNKHIALPDLLALAGCASTTVAACGGDQADHARSGARKPVTRALRVYSPVQGRQRRGRRRSRQKPVATRQRDGTGQLDRPSHACRLLVE